MRTVSAILILLVILAAIYALNITGFGTSDTPSDPTTGMPRNPAVEETPQPLPQ